MVFNSIPFIVFILIFFPIYYALKGNARMIFTLLASYVFYGWWDYRFLALIAFSTLADFYLSVVIDREQDPRRRKYLLAISMVVNLAFLGFFKYFNFFIDSANDLLGIAGYDRGFNALHIILPVGISFYTFQSMSYTIDVYRRVIEPEKSLLKFATFIAFFPQLVAGPIVRAVDFLPQLQQDRKFKWSEFHLGFAQMLVGFGKKLIIADSLAPFVDGVFAFPGNYTSLVLIIGVVFYSFQIYCDFSGYSDIAIGLARMLGFEFPRNFNMPYFSKSFSEFWERWHISLSSWLKDYLYIPLGGNRGGQLKTYRNLMLTMLLGGLWHGANYTFIIWGFLHGAFLIVQRLLNYLKRIVGLSFSGPVNTLVSIAIVYAFTCLAWIYFRSPDVATAHTVIKGILSFNNLSFADLPNKFVIIKGVLLIALLILFELLSLRIDFGSITLRSPAFRTVGFAVILWMIALLGSFIDSQFIYFQF
ncbi:MAG TPA: MBOAT family O-acyltransferase [Chryseosolibacter sp.]|nr:MBOAT family O-acyltransferase [Chryseosolibacter sp.]